MRTEFGSARTACSCANCSINCRFIPGYLIPADLERIAAHVGAENVMAFAAEAEWRLQFKPDPNRKPQM